MEIERRGVVARIGACRRPARAYAVLTFKMPSAPVTAITTSAGYCARCAALQLQLLRRPFCSWNLPGSRINSSASMVPNCWPATISLRKW